MAIKIKKSNEIKCNGVKIIVYGESGSGKTRLAATLPKPIILSAESGLLSLADEDIPYIEVKTLEDIQECYKYLTETEEGKQYQSVCLDSVSEIAESILNNEKALAKDARQAYGAMKEDVGSILRDFRDMPGKHVLFIAKLMTEKDSDGIEFRYPSMPSNSSSQGLPYFFDETFALITKSGANGEIDRRLLTRSGFGNYQAKDRSGALDKLEVADLGAIIKKIQKKFGVEAKESAPQSKRKTSRTAPKPEDEPKREAVAEEKKQTTDKRDEEFEAPF